MDQFPIPNRQRRRSNLGKRNRTYENVPRMAPVFPVPVTRGLGRCRSAKKPQPSVCVPTTSVHLVPTQLPARKKLFRLSPPLRQLPIYDDVNHEERIKQTMPCPNVQNTHSISTSLFPSAHDETGVNMLPITPSPNDRNIHIGAKPYTKYFSNERRVQPPASSGFYSYSGSMTKLLANLKLPVDPEDNNETMQSLTLECSPPADGEEEINPSVQSNDSKINFSSCTNEDLDTTDSFIYAEQTIIDQNQTIIASPQTKESKSVTKSALKSRNKRLEPVLEEVSGSDTDDELLQHVLSKLNTMMVEIESTKKCVHSLIKRRKNKKKENKENSPTTENKQIKDKWVKELKSENPGLLKTPKLSNKERLELALQTTWTPHSLSCALTDQMDDLYE